MKNTFLNTVKGSLIISCQALPNEPLHSSFIMSRMALAAKEAGAAGIRANSVVDIQAIQDEVDLPLIGLSKVDYSDSPVYITPTIKEMRAVAATGCAVVACDVTGQPRPNGEKLAEIVATMRTEFPDTLLMADNDFAYLKEVLQATSRPVIAEGKVDTPEKMKRCLDLGCHAVVVGGAITRPLEIAQRFISAL
ncbi:N-acetylmannosamine-6-phosphate 2-epimerase [Lactiplantibacillus plantarum]|nr:N-acetylmannosamine-6-phosphate 2-epimerase [Lactiplantibacillus plantarum]